ncbi:hypothetical protein PoB_006156300 [Plakobranchus ocellatus]|uniref:Uncharacterized protein n=1 Tax=Plakobranchus ocellatus TaxID=259542 RepID=A0AAV4CT57_9GAST|nr:hypothetical protein PoB_006156300 [Plakobranchus ocellatus]
MITFRMFLKPKTSKFDKCKEWIRLCNQTHDDLNINRIERKTSNTRFWDLRHLMGGNSDMKLEVISEDSGG